MPPPPSVSKVNSKEKLGTGMFVIKPNLGIPHILSKMSTEWKWYKFNDRLLHHR